MIIFTLRIYRKPKAFRRVHSDNERSCPKGRTAITQSDARVCEGAAPGPTLPSPRAQRAARGTGGRAVWLKICWEAQRAISLTSSPSGVKAEAILAVASWTHAAPSTSPAAVTRLPLPQLATLRHSE